VCGRRKDERTFCGARKDERTSSLTVGKRQHVGHHVVPGLLEETVVARPNLGAGSVGRVVPRIEAEVVLRVKLDRADVARVGQVPELVPDIGVVVTQAVRAADVSTVSHVGALTTTRWHGVSWGSGKG
jgi:hypothetical protein